MKIRFKLTVEDYYDYVGTSPLIRLTSRVKSSLPSQLQEGYNMKFKVVKEPYSWTKWYRVHISADITQESLDRMLSNNELFMHKFKNFSMKPIIN
jgi:hypothetical protein